MFYPFGSNHLGFVGRSVLFWIATKLYGVGCRWTVEGTNGYNNYKSSIVGIKPVNYLQHPVTMVKTIHWICSMVHWTSSRARETASPRWSSSSYARWPTWVPWSTRDMPPETAGVPARIAPCPAASDLNIRSTKGEMMGSLGIHVKCIFAKVFFWVNG